MAKTILVAGGAGFIGTHLIRALLDRGDKVIVVDNFSTGSEENLAPFKDNPRFALFYHDICNPLSVEVDEIYNLACPASPDHYQLDPVRTIDTCIQGSKNLLQLAKLRGAKVFFASTSEVYGDPAVHPQPESYYGNVNPNGPRACYDEGKRLAETLHLAYHERDQVPIRIGRFFNTYGPNMQPDDGRVVSNFILQALQNKPITVYGRGKQTRSFCYVSDLVRGIIALMDNEEGLTGPINLGNPEEITVVDFAKVILELTDSSSIISYRASKQDDPTRRQPVIALAKEKLGWEPTIELREGLRQTISYYKDLLQRADSQISDENSKPAKPAPHLIMSLTDKLRRLRPTG